MLILKLVLWVIGLIIMGLITWKSFVLKKERGETLIERVRYWNFIGVLSILVITSIISASFGQVPSGMRGVVLEFGAPNGKVMEEGFYVLKPPFIKTVQLMNVQVQAFEAEASAASKDLQVVTTKVTLNYSLDPNNVVKVYRELREDYVERIIKPAVPEAVKAATARFTAEELITRRNDIRDSINNLMRSRFDNFGIKVNAMSITDFDFSKSFNDAIEKKVTAQQEVLKAEKDLMRIKLEAQQSIEKAKAVAESLRIQKMNVTPDLLRLRTIEAQMAAIEKWNGVMPTTVTGNGPVPILDVFSK